MAVKSHFKVSLIKNRLLFISNSSNGFILAYVLVFFVFFTSIISIRLIQKERSLRQLQFFKEAAIRIQTEKEVIAVISDHIEFPAYEVLVINDQQIAIEYGELIYVRICGEICYVMIVEFDQTLKMIKSISYE